MKPTQRIILFGSLIAACVGSAETVNFDETKPDALPANWLDTQTGSGTAHWSVEKDDSAPSNHAGRDGDLALFALRNLHLDRVVLGTKETQGRGSEL